MALGASTKKERTTREVYRTRKEHYNKNQWMRNDARIPASEKLRRRTSPHKKIRGIKRKRVGKDAAVIIMAELLSSSVLIMFLLLLLLLLPLLVIPLLSLLLLTLVLQSFLLALPPLMIEMLFVHFLPLVSILLAGGDLRLFWLLVVIVLSFALLLFSTSLPLRCYDTCLFSLPPLMSISRPASHSSGFCINSALFATSFSVV